MRNWETFSTSVIAGSRDEALRIGAGQAEAWFGAPMRLEMVSIRPRGGTLGEPNVVTYYEVDLSYTAGGDEL